MSPETYSAFLTAFRHMAVLQEEMTLKLSKTWKGSRQSYAEAFLLEAAKAFDVLKEIGRHALLRTDLPVPEEILALVELSGGAATEWQKVLRYMEDTEGNRLKMEARLHRIASYQERGEKESFALLRFLYNREDAVALIYWKDAVTDLSRFLSAVNRKQSFCSGSSKRHKSTAGRGSHAKRKTAPAICPFFADSPFNISSFDASHWKFLKYHV